MKKRVGSLFLAVLMLFSMGILPGMNRSEAASSVYFTSVNDTLCPLNDATSPYWSDGVLYVASMVFSSYDLGISYARDIKGQTVTLYNRTKVLQFDLAHGGATNMTGASYGNTAVMRSGNVYFPVAFVCSFFDLSYTTINTAWVPLVRVRSDTAILSDRQFVDAAGTLMASRYNSYQQSKKPVPPPTEIQPEPEIPPEAENKSTARIYLGIRGNGENTPEMLETLDRYGYKATFFFKPQTMEGQDDLLRRIVASGHRIGFVQEKNEGPEVLAQANEQLRRATLRVSRLVISDAPETAAAAGYALCKPSVWAENLGKSSAYRTKQVLRQIERSKGRVGLLMGGDEISTESLNGILRQLHEKQYTVRPMNEVCCK